jgi:hypothetical protein
VADPRSPSLGIRRSPVALARKWSYAVPVAVPTEPTVVPPVAETKEKEEAFIEVRVPDVTAELDKLRLEFSAKKQPQRAGTPMHDAKMFMSSPALWKTAGSSPGPFESPMRASDPLLGTWHTPSARRNLFNRSDSASAA